jgi:hypothetical protein
MRTSANTGEHLGAHSNQMPTLYEGDEYPGKQYAFSPVTGASRCPTATLSGQHPVHQLVMLHPVRPMRGAARLAARNWAWPRPDITAYADRVCPDSVADTGAGSHDHARATTTPDEARPRSWNGQPRYLVRSSR